MLRVIVLVWFSSGCSWLTPLILVVHDLLQYIINAGATAATIGASARRRHRYPTPSSPPPPPPPSPLPAPADAGGAADTRRRWQQREPVPLQRRARSRRRQQREAAVAASGGGEIKTQWLTLFLSRTCKRGSNQAGAVTIRISPGPDRITSRINVRIKGIK